MKPPPYILTISGSDSSGCAGMQADHRAISSAGGFPLSALTAVSLQTPEGVEEVQYMPPEFVGKQLRRVLESYPVTAIKSGMLGSVGNAEVVAEVLEEFSGVPYVLDPVLVATSGERLLEEPGIAVVKNRLMRRAVVTTPNSEELRVLCGGSGYRDRIESGAALARETGQSILLKGGHEFGEDSVDWLIGADGSRIRFASPRVPTNNLRGTGCVLASAIATFLGLRLPLVLAVDRGKRLLTDKLEKGSSVLWNHPGPSFW